MKANIWGVSLVAAALAVAPAFGDEKVNDEAKSKVSELDRKTHQQICQGKHGTITDKGANSLTIDGKRYAFEVDTPVNKQEEPLLTKTTKVGDHVCFTTQKAADGSDQISKVVRIDESDKTRVREKESDTPSNSDVKAPAKDVEVK
jgi:hypothetical protein